MYKINKIQGRERQLNGDCCMKTVVLCLLVLIMLVLFAGCQTDITGPSCSMKVLYKGENGNKEYLSRNSSMSSSSGPSRFCWGLGNSQEE